MERWQQWGLAPNEWDDCVEAARELADLSHGERTPSAEEIAAQLAVAKAAEEQSTVPEERMRHVRIDGVQ